MNKLTIITALFLLLNCTSAPAWPADFNVPPSVYKLAPSSKHQLSEAAYRQLQPIQKQISAEQYDRALEALNRLVKRHNQHPYVVSVAMKSAAYIYIAQQAYPNAIKWMQQILKLAAMSDEELQTIRHDLSQLQLQAEQYTSAIMTMEQWLQKADKSQISAGDYQLLAVAQFQLKHYEKSKKAALKGLKQPSPVKEPLYQIILACDIASKNYTSADKVLSHLVTLNPSKNNYWIQWAGVLDLLEKPDQALAVFELMNTRSQLNNEQERIQFVQRLMQQDNAYKAAKLLKGYFKNKEVTPSVENQLLLANALERSGESGEAIEVLKKLLSTQKTIEALTQLAQIYNTEQKWHALVTLLEQQPNEPVTKQNEALYLQLGYGYVQLNRIDKAKQTFLILATSKHSSKETQTSAQQWLKYLIL